MSAVGTDHVGRVEALLEELDGLTDGPARATATQLVQALLDLYGEGLARIVGEVAEADHDGRLAEALGGDELVAHLLLLHGLHPVALEARVRGALDGLRPYVETHGGNVALLGIDEGVVRLQLQGSCSGCPSSAVTLKLAVEEAIHKAAPDVTDIVAVDAPPAPIGLEVYEACPAPLHR